MRLHALRFEYHLILNEGFLLPQGEGQDEGL